MEPHECLGAGGGPEGQEGKDVCFPLKGPSDMRA